MTRPNATAFELLPTVRGFLTDAAIRTGVNALLKVKANALPPDLSLDELGYFLAARGTAELTKFDWAAMLHALWSLTWAAALPPSWKAAPLSELAGEGYDVTPEGCWATDTFSIYHTRNSQTLYTAVSVYFDRTEIAFSLETDDGELLIPKDCDPFIWRDDEHWEGWLVMTVPVSPANAAFSLQDLQRAAARSIDRVDASATT